MAPSTVPLSLRLHVPESMGERVPLRDGGWLAFDGRLDDREALLHSLPERPATGASDALLAAGAWEAWNTGAFSRLFGSFAIVLWDAASGTAVLARDPLGARALVYTREGRDLTVARELSPEPPAQLDPHWLAAYFAVAEPEPGTTPFAGIRELPPGHWLRITAAGSELRAFWNPPRPETDSAGPRDWSAAIREAFQAAVSCRLRDLENDEPVAILLSGGLDSVPIAAAARRALPAQRILAVSWTFERHPAADERREIAAAVEAFGLEPVAVPCDDALPLGDLATWPVHPGTPEQNPYRRFHERAYRAAAAHGARVVLSGMCGDQLWSEGETWLADLLRRGRIAAAAGEVAWHLRQRLPIRPALRSWLGRSGGGDPRRLWPWLTPGALALAPRPAARRYADYPRPRQAELLLGSANGHGFAVEAYFARRAGIEVRYPLRDRRLIELALALPASEIYHRGIQRAGLRRAFAGELPEVVRTRRGKANFSSLFQAGTYDVGRPAVERLLAGRDAVWRQFVRAAWIDRALRSSDLGRAGLLLWLAVSLELWLRRRGTTPFGLERMAS
jgi:asparagine synthase (glutamine-hydrolysing)